MSNDVRPLSPHLQVYRPQLTSTLSILHRVTGFGLALAAPLFVWWLCAAASGPAAFATLHAFTGSILGQVMLFGWLYSFVYHFLNGFRHLFWDMGYGFKLKTAYASGWFVFIASIVLTAVIWCAKG